MGRACSVNLESNFLLMGGAVFPPSQLLGLRLPSQSLCSPSTYANTPHLPGLLLPMSLFQQQAAGKDPETLTGKFGSIFVGNTASFPWVLVAHMIFFVTSKGLWRLSYSFSFVLGCRVCFFLVGSNLLLSMVVQHLVVILMFLQKMSAWPSTLASFTSLLSSIREQTEEARIIIIWPLEQKSQSQETNKNDYMDQSLKKMKL